MINMIQKTTSINKDYKIFLAVIYVVVTAMIASLLYSNPTTSALSSKDEAVQARISQYDFGGPPDPSLAEDMTEDMRSGSPSTKPEGDEKNSATPGVPGMDSSKLSTNAIPKVQLDGSTVNQAYNGALAIAGIVAVIFVIVGGIKYSLSSGDPSELSKAKNTILYSIVGLIVVISAFMIVRFVTGSLGDNNPETRAPDTSVPEGGSGGGAGFDEDNLTIPTGDKSGHNSSGADDAGSVGGGGGGGGGGSFGGNDRPGAGTRPDRGTPPTSGGSW